MTEPKFNCLSSKLFEHKSIFRLSWNSISSHRSCSKTFPNCVLAESQLHLIKIILNNSIICLSRKSIASHRNIFMTAPYCVLAENQVHLIEFILQQIWNVSSSKFNCISSKLVYDNSKLCPSHSSIAPYRKKSKTNPNCVWAEIQVHLIENILKQLHIASQPKFNCIWLKLF